MICGKNIHPVTPDGEKIIDVTVGAFNKQIDKNEKTQIKTLNFVGFTGSPLRFEKKDMDLILDLPNLKTIELEERPTNFSGVNFNIILDEVPGVETVILNSYDKNGEKIYAPNTISFFDIGDGSDIYYRIESALKDFPNINTFIQNYGIPQDLGNLNHNEYAIYLGKKTLNPTAYYERPIGNWSAHAIPSEGLIVFEKNKKTDFSSELTIIPSLTKIDDIINDLPFTNIDKYNVKIPSNFIYIGDVEGSQTFNIMESENPLYVTKIEGKGEKMTINRPIVMTGGDFKNWPSVQSLTFSKPLWVLGPLKAYSNLKEIKFNDNVVINNLDVFKGIPRIEFTKIPQVIGNKYNDWGETVIEIPDGTLNDFIALGFPQKNINTITSQPISITVKEPNTILSYISPDKLKDVEDLTVIGFLYDTDIKILSKCENLKKLDLSRTIITTSPQTQKERQEDADALNALFGVMNEMAQAKYKAGEVTSETAMTTSMLSTLADMNASSINSGVNDCGIPGGAFKGLKYLQSVKLPLTATFIGGNSFADCSSLKDVEFPPYLKTVNIGAFSNTGLVKVKLPSSVESLSDYRNGVCAFGNCSNLELLDAGDCEFSQDQRKQVSWRDPLYKCKALVLPKNTQRIQYLQLPSGSELYCPPTLKEFNNNESYRNLTIYVQTKEAASGYLYDCTIYVPEGGMTSWYAKYGDRNKIIEGTKSRP